MQRALDVKIANFFRRCFAYYIRKREKPQPDPEMIKMEKWLANFENTKNEFVYPLDTNINIVLYKDSLLCQYIYSSFEEAEISFIKKFLFPGDVFFDIGSNIGLFSLHASPIVEEKGLIYAFEPTPLTYSRLEKNIEINEFKNIKTENIGLSNTEDTLSFYVSKDGHDAWNSFATLNDIDTHESISVPVTSLDNYIINNKIGAINLIKIDVEGWELNVLKGAKKLLSKNDSPVLLVEFTETNAFAAGYYCGELFDYVKSFGYEWYSYDVNSNSLLKQQKKLHYPYENLIAIKNMANCIKRIESSQIITA